MANSTRMCANCEMNWDHVSDECENCGMSAARARITRPNWQTAEVA